MIIIIRRNTLRRGRGNKKKKTQNKTTYMEATGKER